MPDSDNLLLPLPDVVEDLREQLGRAVLAAAADGVRFQVNSVELEFSVVAKRDVGGDGKIKFAILGVGAELGASGKLAMERAQKVKFSLTPVMGAAGAEVKKLEISRKPPLKAGVKTVTKTSSKVAPLRVPAKR